MVPYGEAKTTVKQLIQSKLQGQETEWDEDLNEVLCGGWTCFEKDCAIISKLRIIGIELNRSHPGGLFRINNSSDQRDVEKVLEGKVVIKRGVTRAFFGSNQEDVLSSSGKLMENKNNQ